MSAKQMQFDAEARESFLSGVSQLARAVSSTMGPSGRNVVVQKSFGGPSVTKDGVSVSKEIELEGPFENVDELDSGVLVPEDLFPLVPAPPLFPPPEWLRIGVYVRRALRTPRTKSPSRW